MGGLGEIGKNMTVVEYDGRIVNAPYHSTCGGSTAAASDVWRSADEPYLQPVSDRMVGRE